MYMMENHKGQIKDDKEEEEDNCCWMEKEYAEKTTCQGLHCIFTHDSYFAKSVWIFIILGN